MTWTLTCILVGLAAAEFVLACGLAAVVWVERE